MKQIFTRLSLIGAFALILLAVGCAQMEQTENLLSAAGFRVVVAATPQQQHHLKTLTPYKVTAVRRNGKPYYVYADPSQNLIYVGSQFQYYRYRDLRLEKNLAQEDVQTSELNADQAQDWDVWGPWSFQNH
jgi:hypothetical protein